MKKMTFYKYSERYLDQGTPTGVFARAMRRDEHFPKMCDDHDRIRGHLLSMRACHEAVSAFEQLWRNYVAYKTRKEQEA